MTIAQPAAPVTSTTCPICHEEQKSLPALARHLMTHPEAQETTPEQTAPKSGTVVPKKGRKPVDWEGTSTDEVLED